MTSQCKACSKTAPTAPPRGTRTEAMPCSIVMETRVKPWLLPFIPSFTQPHLITVHSYHCKICTLISTFLFENVKIVILENFYALDLPNIRGNFLFLVFFSFLNENLSLRAYHVWGFIGDELLKNISVLLQ